MNLLYCYLICCFKKLITFEVLVIFNMPHIPDLGIPKKVMFICAKKISMKHQGSKSYDFPAYKNVNH